MKKRNFGYLLIFLGLLMFCGSAVIHIFNEKQDRIAGENAALLMENWEQELHFNIKGMDEYYLYDMTGVLQIPSLGLELPVLNEWNYDLLQMAPCRYSGSVETNDLILMGHDYQSHFGKLEELQEGETIFFLKKGDFVPYSYVVKEMETLHKTELEELTSSAYPLSVFTCTDSGQYRLVIRCVSEE